jgi:hypothetical protein
MQQMTAPHVPVLEHARYDTIEHGFMRDSQGRIYFLTTHGHDTLHFPVLTDGTISRQNWGIRFPTEIVTLIHPNDLGITKFRWAAPRKARRSRTSRTM